MPRLPLCIEFVGCLSDAGRETVKESFNLFFDANCSEAIGQAPAQVTESLELVLRHSTPKRGTGGIVDVPAVALDEWFDKRQLGQLIDPGLGS